MRFRIDFGWENSQSIYAFFEAETYEQAALHAQRLHRRIRILEAVRIEDNAPLDSETLTPVKIDASRWLESG